MQYPYFYDKGHDLLLCPPHRLVQSPEIRDSLKFLDVVATPTAEFFRNLAKFSRASGSSRRVRSDEGRRVSDAFDIGAERH